MTASPSTTTRPAPTSSAAPATATASPAVDGKWWGHSMTIWGVIITSLVAVVPSLGGLAGFDISAELARQLGDQIIRAVQAVGGLAGLVITIMGRVRATAPLERRSMTLRV